MFKRKSTDKKATVSLFQRVKTRLASWKQKAALPDSYPDFAKTVAPAMEQLTKQLIEETVGSRSEMMQSFRRQMAAYNTNTTPISPEHAKKIIFSMLDGAVANRKLINERLVQSVEVGSLYRNYYGRVQAVDDMSIRAYAAMEQMNLAEEDFMDSYAMLMQVRKKSVVDGMGPDEEDQKALQKLRNAVTRRKRDIMEALDEMGGG